jgi:hypothetical protein
MFNVQYFLNYRTCRQVGGPNQPKVDDCLSETDPCTVNINFISTVQTCESMRHHTCQKTQIQINLYYHSQLQHKQ